MHTLSLVFGLTFLLVCTTVLSVHTYMLCGSMRRKNQTITIQKAKEQFYWQRELIEARFVTFAQLHMDSNLWLWDEAEFGSHVLIACSKKEKVVYAYLPVTVEMNRPVRHHSPKNDLFFRQVTVIAKFSAETECWELNGRAFFNQSPRDIIYHRAQDLCMVDSLESRVA